MYNPYQASNCLTQQSNLNQFFAECFQIKVAKIEEGEILKLVSHLVLTQLAQNSTNMKRKKKKKKKKGISEGCLLKLYYHHEDVFFFKMNEVETTSDYFHFC